VKVLPWMLLLGYVASGLGQQTAPVAEHLPLAMRGPWVITQQLTEKSLGCFDPEHAQRLVGLKFSLSESGVVWNGSPRKELEPHTRRVSRYEFEARYGQKAKELGIDTDPVPIVQVVPSYGVPVNLLVMGKAGVLLIDACNIWLEAQREP
jgi:hypothetical protein